MKDANKIEVARSSFFESAATGINRESWPEANEDTISGGTIKSFFGDI